MGHYPPTGLLRKLSGFEDFSREPSNGGDWAGRLRRPVHARAFRSPSGRAEGVSRRVANNAGHRCGYGVDVGALGANQRQRLDVGVPEGTLEYGGAREKCSTTHDEVINQQEPAGGQRAISEPKRGVMLEKSGAA